MDIDDLKNLLSKGERVNVECKESKSSIPNDLYSTYSAFANTNGGHIILGIKEDKSKSFPSERFVYQGVQNAAKQISDFWNTINGNKVNCNILTDDDVSLVEDGDTSFIVIHVPRANYQDKPIYVGENPLKGTYKRNNEGDYHATYDEIKAMIRDESSDGNDSMIVECSTMEEIDTQTLKRYRTIFDTLNPEHIWTPLNDKDFLEQIGGYRIDKKEKREGLTLAGFMMFGKGLAIRNEFSNVFMDYRDESSATLDERWQDRLTYDGRWENNLFNFYTLVCPKLMTEIKRPFKLNGIQRIDDTPVHKAIREAFVNLLIHADYQLDAGTLKVIKTKNGFEFTNPGCLKIPRDQIYHGGVSRPRNPHIQAMMRMIGFGDNIGSGFPAILAAWKSEGWIQPELKEDTVVNQVTLSLQMVKEEDKDPVSNLKISPNQEKLLKLIAKNPSITRAELAEKLGVSQTTIQKYISSLKKASLLIRHGSDHVGYWEVKWI